jgi:hypothetical protein
VPIAVPRLIARVAAVHTALTLDNPLRSGVEYVSSVPPTLSGKCFSPHTKLAVPSQVFAFKNQGSHTFSHGSKSIISSSPCKVDSWGDHSCDDQEAIWLITCQDKSDGSEWKARVEDFIFTFLRLKTCVAGASHPGTFGEACNTIQI